MSFQYDERLDGPLQPAMTRPRSSRNSALLCPTCSFCMQPKTFVRSSATASSAYRTTPMMVAAARAVEQVQALLKFATARNVPVAARGSGHRPVRRRDAAGKGHPLLVMARLTAFSTSTPEAGTAREQPGVRNLAISQAAAPHGLYYAPDPSSQIACSIGGNVAENAGGGVHCLKYGLTVAQHPEGRNPD